MREVYKTKQKERIIEEISTLNKEFTVSDLYDKLNHTIGLTTIYRLIDKLVEENKIKKIPSKGNKTYYQYLKECQKENHFYLKCSHCGDMIHVDCDCINDLSSHIEKEHDFELEKNHILISGICKKCRRN